MALIKRKTKMRRTQVSLMPEDYELAKKIAAKRGASLSQVVRDALRKEMDAEITTYDPLGAMIGIVDNADPNASEKLDEIIYGRDIR